MGYIEFWRGRQAGREAVGRQAGRKRAREAGRQAGRQTDREAGRQAEWQAGRQGGREGGREGLGSTHGQTALLDGGYAEYAETLARTCVYTRAQVRESMHAHGSIGPCRCTLKYSEHDAG